MLELGHRDTMYGDEDLILNFVSLWGLGNESLDVLSDSRDGHSYIFAIGK